MPHTKSGGGGGGGGGGQFASGPIYEKWGGGGAVHFRSDIRKVGGQFASGPIRKVGGQSTSGPIYKKWGGGGGGQFASGTIRKVGGGGGGGQFASGTIRKVGGGGGNSLLVSYPDPYVRNDDHRLQYDITYRGSGNKVVRNGSSATECSGMAEAIQHWSGLGVAIKFFYIDSCHTL